MSDIILHHYPESPFSEKIRLLLAYKEVSYKSVMIPIIMPKPDLMPLTGGYRKTPVMQVGADIYCDSAIIAKTIDEMYPESSVYPGAFEGTCGATAHWTDTFFFKVAVAVAFQPKGLASNTILSDPEAAAAFAADRAELTKGSSELGMPPETAVPFFFSHLERLERQLGSTLSFLFSNEPTIADFSTYHCLWFIHNNQALARDFKPYPRVLDWMKRMADLGTKKSEDLSGSEAISIASASTSTSTESVDGRDGLAGGSNVIVIPIDYGFQPVTGKLVVASAEEIAIRRTDPKAGEVVVHFPRFGFQVRAAD